MKLFHFTADAILEAEDIVDAMEKIGKQFTEEASGDYPGELFLPDSKVEIHPVEQPTQQTE